MQEELDYIIYSYGVVRHVHRMSLRCWFSAEKLVFELMDRGSEVAPIAFRQFRFFYIYALYIASGKRAAC